MIIERIITGFVLVLLCGLFLHFFKKTDKKTETNEKRINNLELEVEQKLTNLFNKIELINQKSLAPQEQEEMIKRAVEMAFLKYENNILKEQKRMK